MRIHLIVLLALVFVRGASAQPESRHYGLRYEMTLKPTEDRADVSLAVDQRIKDNIWSWRFRIDPERHDGFVGDGQVEREDPYVTWTPPEDGGRLSFHVPVSHRRGKRFDARMTDEWAVFRGDDLFPPARTDQHEQAEADATLHVFLPKDWSFVSAYPDVNAGHVYRIEHAHRSFDRPTGWMAAGRLGVRRERIAGVRVAVAGPVDQGVRRMDMLAMLNWNLPEFRRLVPEMPKRILIVSAGDQTWRGGLSGPHSLYMHADLPMISEDGTSTLVHEMMHVVTRIRGVEGADWIAEGVAEYYSLKLMRRSGTITERRFQRAMRDADEWGEEADRLDVRRSTGAVTARAVGVFRELDEEIVNETEGERSLDDVVRRLSGDVEDKVTIDQLRRVVADVMGKPAEALSDQRLGFDGDEN